ncbi:MAG: hypothetical protein J6R93_02455 [Tidjanibacter sp.]|nr:hypothetical protein [Tidjanibacter sp.]
MKKTYMEPAIYIENVVVENGIAASVWGNVGEPGQSGDYYDYEDEL